MTDRPVEGYGSEFLALYMKAAKETVTIRLPSRALAFRLRFQLHDYRKGLRKEDHPMLPAIEPVVVRAPHRDGEEWLVTLEPVSASFSDAIRAAGVDVAEELKPQPIAKPEDDDYFKGL